MVLRSGRLRDHGTGASYFEVSVLARSFAVHHPFSFQISNHDTQARIHDDPGRGVAVHSRRPLDGLSSVGSGFTGDGNSVDGLGGWPAASHVWAPIQTLRKRDRIKIRVC